MAFLKWQRVDLRPVVNICEDCPLSERQTVAHVPFEIVGDQPRVVFVAESPGFQEIEEQRPLVGRSGQFIRPIVEGFLESYALANVVSCHPKLREAGIHTPEDDEQRYCKPHVAQFIEDLQPDLVVLLGKIAATQFYPGAKKNSSLKTLIEKGPMIVDDICYVCDYHPSYILRNGGVTSHDFPFYVARLRRALEPYAVKDTFRDGEDEEDDEWEDAFLRDIRQASELKPPDDLDWKLCTVDDLVPLLEHLKTVDVPVGFDFEALTVNPWDIDNKPTGFSFAYRTSETSGKAWFVHLNRPMTAEEDAAFLAYLRTTPPWTYNANYEGGMVWAQWGEQIPFHDVYVLCKIDGQPGGLKVNARFYLQQDLGWEDEVGKIVKLFENLFQSMRLVAASYPDGISLLRQGDLLGWVTVLCTIIQRRKKLRRVNSALALLRRDLPEPLVREGLTRYPYAWGAVPIDTLAEYCCWDSYYTVKLHDLLLPTCEDYYPEYIVQTWLSGVMEAYGHTWNDAKASELELYYLQQSVQTLSDLIQQIAVEDEAKLEALALQPADWQDRDALQKSLDALKKIYNPLSNDAKAQIPFWTAYRTDRSQTLLTLHYLETEILQSEMLDEVRLLPLFDRENMYVTMSNLSAYEDVASPDNHEITAAVSKLIKSVPEQTELLFSSLKIDTMHAHYQAWKHYAEVEIDKESTWTPEFRLLYLVKRFKKVQKSLSTYIRGRVGRKSVSVCDLGSWDQPPHRLERYLDYPATDAGQHYLLNVDFRANTASTRRWRSPGHTIPALSELQEIYETRFPEGLLVHSDLKQNEIRVLCSLAGEQRILDALEQGLDVHAFVAATIANKAVKDVTKAERRAAKSAVFGIIYGQSLFEFARQNMNGNLVRAQNFFQRFFQLFPGILRFINEQHDMGRLYGRVHTVFGDPLVIDVDRYGLAAAMRHAQNWGVQSSASSLAAIGIYNLYREMQRRKFPGYIYGFQHDAKDSEIHTAYLVEFLEMIQEQMVQRIRRKYDVLVDADYEIGLQKNKMMKLETTGPGVYAFECAQDTFATILAHLQRFLAVDYTVTEEETKLDSLEELFASRRAFSRSLGQEQTVYKGELRLQSLEKG